MNLKVSIITPTYNSEKYISESINSVLNQTYQNWELILVDDASTDNTVSIIENHLKNDKRIKFYKNNINQGTAISRNKGIDMASGRFIAFLDADDLWKPSKLIKQVEFMQKQDCDVCFSSYEQIDEQGNQLNKLVSALPKLSFNKLLKSNYIGNLTGMYDVEKIGKIKTSDLRKRQDWLLWLRAVKKSKQPAIGIKESLAYYRVRQDSISSQKINLLKYNYLVYKKGLGYSTLKSLYRMGIFLIEHFFVKPKQTIDLNKK